MNPTKTQIKAWNTRAEKFATNVQKELVKELKHVMIDRELTQKQVAHVLGISQSFLSEVFNNKKSMTLVLMHKIKIVFEL